MSPITRVLRRLDHMVRHYLVGGVSLAVALLVVAVPAQAQNTFIRDLTLTADDVPVRLVGYGLVSGLEGTGDRVSGAEGGGPTVRSIVNMLRRAGIEVPPENLRSRNVAAVLVMAEVSAYTRPGGRMDVHVSSIGDAVSLRGGVLLTTPLGMDLGSQYLASAQGPIMVADGFEDFGGGRQQAVETTGRIPLGGVVEQRLPAADFMQSNTLLLRNPDVGTAQRMVDAINAAIGSQVAALLDPGALSLQLDNDPTQRANLLAQILAVSMIPVQSARVLVDGRAGTVVAGGDIRVGSAVVSHGGVTISIIDEIVQDDRGGSGAPGAMAFQTGASVQEVAEALHAVATPPSSIAAIFTALREVGAISAQVVVR